MDVLIVTVFCSLVLVVAGLLLFVSRLREGDFEHGDRLSLLPLADDENPDAAGDEPPPARLNEVESISAREEA